MDDSAPDSLAAVREGPPHLSFSCALSLRGYRSAGLGAANRADRFIGGQLVFYTCRAFSAVGELIRNCSRLRQFGGYIRLCSSAAPGWLPVSLCRLCRRLRQSDSYVLPLLPPPCRSLRLCGHLGLRAAAQMLLQPARLDTREHHDSDTMCIIEEGQKLILVI